MAVRVLSRTPYPGLVSLAAAKAYLGITDSTSDTLLQSLIDAVSNLFEVEIGRPLLRQQYEETLPGEDRKRLLLSRFPIDPDSVAVEINDVADTTFSVEESSTGTLYRATSWPSRYPALGEASQSNIAVTYRAGWVPPDALRTWSTGLTLASGAWLRPSSPASSPLLFEITTAGASGSGSEPTWPTTAGATVAVGTATATARDAVEVPKAIALMASFTVYMIWKAKDRQPGMTSLSADGFSASWSADAAWAGIAIPPQISAALQAWRSIG